tara:strand:- start:1114 stop:1395 length:282 start_codon:yes stop_codon:yes gene_type:complete
MKRASFRRLIRRVIQETAGEEAHRCLNGECVPLSSPECTIDLEFRISDATADRDSFDTRTDARTHYNGLLKVLRRKLRQSKKMQLQDLIDLEE